MAQFLSSARSTALSLLAFSMSLHVPLAHAGEILKCEINGIKTFVDSAHGCPGGRAERWGGANTAAEPSPRRSDPKPAPQRMRDQPPSSGPARLKSATSIPPACLNKHDSDPAVLRQCLAGLRREETRAVAQPRLAAVSRALADFATGPRSEEGVLAVRRTGRPAKWCEQLLNDVIALRNVDVIDSPGSAGTLPREAGEILDPEFKLVQFEGSQVVDGYVTLRWHGFGSVVLHMLSACTDAAPGEAQCSRPPYSAVLVHDSERSKACQVSFIGRTYWRNSRDSMTQVFLAQPR